MWFKKTDDKWEDFLGIGKFNYRLRLFLLISQSNQTVFYYTAWRSTLGWIRIRRGFKNVIECKEYDWIWAQRSLLLEAVIPPEIFPDEFPNGSCRKANEINWNLTENFRSEYRFHFRRFPVAVIFDLGGLCPGGFKNSIWKFSYQLSS